jgi:hypothetical protein
MEGGEEGGGRGRRAYSGRFTIVDKAFRNILCQN